MRSLVKKLSDPELDWETGILSPVFKRLDAHLRRAAGERRGSRERLWSLGVDVPELDGEMCVRLFLKNERELCVNAVSASVSTERGRSEPLGGGVVEMRGKRGGPWRD